MDDLTLSNPLARLERLGTGWLGAVFDWEGVLVEDGEGDEEEGALQEGEGQEQQQQQQQQQRKEETEEDMWDELERENRREVARLKRRTLVVLNVMAMFYGRAHRARCCCLVLSILLSFLVWCA